MKAALRGSRQIIDREIAVGNAVEAVRGRSVETERVGGALAIDWEAGAGQRGLPSGLSFIRVRASANRERRGEHLVIGHQMVAERHRLRDLQMSKAGHHPLGMLVGARDQRALKSRTASTA